MCPDDAENVEVHTNSHGGRERRVVVTEFNKENVDVVLPSQRTCSVFRLPARERRQMRVRARSRRDQAQDSQRSVSVVGGW